MTRLAFGAKSRTAAAARLVDAQGFERLAALQGGQVDFPNLPVGTYWLELCADPECASLQRDRETVEVQPLETLKLRR